MNQLSLLDSETLKKVKVSKPDLIRPWMKRHGISIHFAAHMKPWCWSAWVGTHEDIGSGVPIYEGKTRNEALKELCELRGDIPMWDDPAEVAASNKEDGK